jgi:hypothetical protein
MTQKTASGFTPGPWTDRGQHPYLVAMAHHVPVMLDTPDSGGGPEYSVSTAEQSGANARLIAAAPEMYELLGKLLEGNGVCVYHKDPKDFPHTCYNSLLCEEGERIKAEIDGEG